MMLVVPESLYDGPMNFIGGLTRSHSMQRMISWPPLRGSLTAGSAFSQLRDNTVKTSMRQHVEDVSSVRTTLTALRDQHCGQLDVQAALAAALEAEETGEVRSTRS
jgi:hypothetical protein